MAGQTPLPLRVLVTAAADAPVAMLARRIEDSRLIVTSCATEDDARRALIARLPDVAILDGSLPGASLLRVYTELRPEHSSNYVPVMFTGHAMDASAVAGGIPDIYLASDADLDAVRSAVYQSLGLPLPEPVSYRATQREQADAPDAAQAGASSSSRPFITARNPLVRRVLRALPIAAMIAIGGLAGVMIVKKLDTRSWPPAPPNEVRAASPLATSSPPGFAATEAPENPLVALETSAASTSSESRVIPESPSCALIPAFERLREQVGEETVGGCTHQPTVRENGDAQQVTTRGLFALWSKEGWVTFTDGYRAWVNAPNGVQQQLNPERFSSESASAALDESAIVSAEASPID